MADIAPMLGAILGVSNTKQAKGKGKKSAPKAAKSKQVPEAVPHHVVVGVSAEPVSDKKIIKDNAKHTLRRATDDWVEGRITTKEHKAVHERTKHVLSGKQPHEFRGMSGERSFKKMR
jgi:hypothetical protein